METVKSIKNFSLYNTIDDIMYTYRPTKKTSYRPFKLETVEEVEAGMHPDEVALSFNVSRSNVIKQVKQNQKLIDAAKYEYKNHLKIRRATKYVNLYKVLEKKFKECRAKGYRISFAWLWSRARTIYREQLGDESATVKYHVTVNFIKIYNLRMRKKQRSKNVSKEDMRAKMME